MGHDAAWAAAGRGAIMDAPINKEINAVLDGAKAREFMAKNFLELAFGTPGEFQEFLKQDRASAGQLIKKFGVK
jgi:tripartite-type tricarboxylate transporter receptor subunit TctC